MSIFQSLVVGISGLQAQTQTINTIADNLANANTVGYKRHSVNFRSLLGSESASSYTPAGARSYVRHINHASGVMLGSSSASDLAVSGGGFFAVRSDNATTGSVVYTRAGAFATDADGNYRNGAGLFLQGWLLEDEQLPSGLSGGSIPSANALAALVPVNINNLAISSSATTTVQLTANLRASQVAIPNATVTVETNLDPTEQLHPSAMVSVVANLSTTATPFSGVYNPAVSAQNMASGNITPNYMRTVSVVDNTGASHTIRLSFLNTATDTWAVEIHAEPAADVTQTDGQLAYGTLTFNSNGTLATISPALTSAISAGWNNVGGATSLDFDFGDINSNNGIQQEFATYLGTVTSGPDYDPAVAGQSMTTGAVTPDFTQNITAVDNSGTTRTLQVGYFKLAADTWAVEIYGVPASSVTSPSGVVAGQVAHGTVTFSSSGQLTNISQSLQGTLPVGWDSNYLQNNSIVFNWNASGTSDGITQSTSASYANTSSVLEYNAASSTANMSDGTFPPAFTRVTEVVDSEGETHNITIGFIKTSGLTWAVEMYADSAAEIGSTSAQIASGTVTFNGDGTLASISSGLSSAIDINWATPAAATNSITFDWGTPGAIGTGQADGLAQFDSAYTATTRQNGYAAGTLNDISFTDEGYVVGNFNNGVSRRLYQIPLATFIAQDQLQNLSGSAFQETLDSGSALFTLAGIDAQGRILSGALESSNVDTATQITDMIIAQRAYQANTKTITVSDDMLKELKNLKS